jgi:hypothetical protein
MITQTDNNEEANRIAWFNSSKFTRCLTKLNLDLISKTKAEKFPCNKEDQMGTLTHKVILTVRLKTI